MINWFVDILSAIGGTAGIVALFQFLNTRKPTKRKAEAESMAIVQDVYVGMIDNMNKRLTELEERIDKWECLRKDCKDRI